MTPTPSRRDPKESILIVDDQQSLCETIRSYLQRQYSVVCCAGVDEALEHIEREHVDLILTDISMPGKSGMELLKTIRKRGGVEAVVMMTAFASFDQCVEAMRLGASDYITKPFRLPDLGTVIAQTLRRRAENLESNVPKQTSLFGFENRSVSKKPSLRNSIQNPVPLVGSSPIMGKLFNMIERVATTDSSVLLVGATGTGKELVARQIHELSERRDNPFIDINCSAIPETLIEAELFGHERGTFTGATETRPGLFEEASGSTLFLDEIDALHHSAQAKLLRVLQERQVRRVGGRKNIPVDVRIIAATNKDIPAAVASGTFRHDLMYRLCVVPIHVPELYEREGDVALLVEYFLERHATRRGTAPKSVIPAAMQLLENYRWPGNVRELENAIEYGLVVSEGREIGVEDLPETLRNNKRNQTKAPSMLSDCVVENAPLAEVERRYVELMLERHDGHHIKTAAALGIDRRTLSRKLQQYGSRILRKEENGNGLDQRHIGRQYS